jgi:hypothetical protein
METLFHQRFAAGGKNSAQNLSRADHRDESIA